MFNRVMLLASAALIVVAARPAQAQAGAHQKWWLSSEIRSDLALSSRQVQQLDAIYQESLPARRRIRQELTALHDRLTQLIDEGRLDDAAARPVVEHVFAVEKRRNVARTLMLVRMYRVLSPDQRARLADWSARR
jgi:Spy/CpxP family protein refolding chaperone